MASLEFTPPVTGFSWGREGGEGGGGGHTCLDDEDVLVPDRLPKLNRCLIVAELIQDHLGARLGIEIISSQPSPSQASLQPSWQ